MKTFDELFGLYTNGDEAIYDELNDVDFIELYTECSKNLAKYYDFNTWLANVEHYINKEDR